MSSSDSRYRIGTLGSELTFAGQATARLLERLAVRDEVHYLPTMDDVATAVLDGTIELGVLTSETSRTACTDTAARLLAGDDLFVVEEILVPYHCALLVKAGTRIDDIKHVGGHGSLRQCAQFLATRMPDATVKMHELNSVEAAREVLAGDGSTAVIATEALAAELGLEILERDVDGGAVGGWWALSATLHVPADADHIALRLESSEALERVFAMTAKLGLRIRTVTNQPTGKLFHYRYLVTARTPDGRPVGDAATEAFGSDLIGVFSSTTAS